MNPDIQALMSVLFEPGEATCFTQSPRGTAVSAEPSLGDEFFCINPLDQERDRAPTELWHNLNKPRRADANVTCFRNLLIELDNMPIQQQRSYVLNKLPVTSIVYSGNKSFHFIVSLTEPLSSIDEYREVFRRVQRLLPSIDKSCKNPSRLSRLPGVVRADTMQVQKLEHLGTRVSTQDLLALLPEAPVVVPSDKQKSFMPIDLMQAVWHPNYVMQRVGLQGRNQFFFWLHNRMKELGLSPDEQRDAVERAYNNLQDTSDFSIHEAFAAARVRTW